MWIIIKVGNILIVDMCRLWHVYIGFVATYYSFLYSSGISGIQCPKKSDPLNHQNVSFSGSVLRFMYINVFFYPVSYGKVGQIVRVVSTKTGHNRYKLFLLLSSTTAKFPSIFTFHITAADRRRDGLSGNFIHPGHTAHVPTCVHVYWMDHYSIFYNIGAATVKIFMFFAILLYTYVLRAKK